MAQKKANSGNTVRPEPVEPRFSTIGVVSCAALRLDRLRTNSSWRAFRSESRDYLPDRTHVLSVNFSETNEYLTNLPFLPYPILIEYGGI